MRNARGQNISGIDHPVTPAKFHSVAKEKAPAARIVKFPNKRFTHMDWEAANPTLKGFVGAHPEDGKPYFPVNAIRTVDRGYVGGEDARGTMTQKGSGSNDGMKAKRTSPPATVKTHRG